MRNRAAKVSSASITPGLPRAPVLLDRYRHHPLGHVGRIKQPVQVVDLVCHQTGQSVSEHRDRRTAAHQSVFHLDASWAWHESTHVEEAQASLVLGIELG